MNDSRKIIFGADPSTSNCGIALIHRSRVISHKTCTGVEAITRIKNLHFLYKFERAVVEKPRKGVVYGCRASRMYSQAGIISLAQDIGKNIEITDRIVKTLCDLGVRVLEKNPTSKSTKPDKEYWRRVFGWTEGRLPSEHARDAAYLAFLNENWVGWNLPDKY